MKKHYFLTTVSIICCMLSACASNAETGTNETTTAQETAAEETTQEETEAQAISIGTAGTIGDWTITVDNVQILTTVPDGYVEFNADEGNQYLLISLTATNEGKEAGRFMPSFGMTDDISAKVIYGDGYEYTQTNLMGYSKSMMDSTINPLSTKSGDLAFELPDSIANSGEPLTLEISAGSDTIDFAIR